MQDRDIIGEVANGLDLTNERGTEQHSAEQLVVRLDHAIAPLRARSVKGDIVTVGREACTICLRITAGPCLADPLEQDFELVVVVHSLHIRICGGLIIRHMSMLDRKRQQGTALNGRFLALPAFRLNRPGRSRGTSGRRPPLADIFCVRTREGVACKGRSVLPDLGRLRRYPRSRDVGRIKG
jgi:hypothetical protein